MQKYKMRILNVKTGVHDITENFEKGRETRFGISKRSIIQT
jgi:hypothetical protein